MPGGYNYGASNSLGASFIDRFEDLPLNRSVPFQEPVIWQLVRPHVMAIPIQPTLRRIRLCAGTSLGGARSSLYSDTHFGICLDQTDALHRSFPSGRVCEG